MRPTWSAIPGERSPPSPNRGSRLCNRRPGRRTRRPSGPAAEAAAADPEVSAVELAFWDTVKDSANPEMYSAYLERYPEGAFAALAKVRLDELDAIDPKPLDR